MENENEETPNQEYNNENNYFDIDEKDINEIIAKPKNLNSVPLKKLSIYQNRTLQSLPSREYEKKGGNDMKNIITSYKNLNEINETLNEINEINEENYMNLDDSLKDFEKGADFKNFYPDFNLQNFIKNNNTKRGRKIRTLKNGSLNPHHPSIKKKDAHQKGKSLKNNKIFPEIDLKAVINFDGRIKKNKNSNIFKQKAETHLFDSDIKNRMTFYDVVNEVLNNNDLRKKLSSIKQKSEKFKRRKYLF